MSCGVELTTFWVKLAWGIESTNEIIGGKFIHRLKNSETKMVRDLRCITTNVEMNMVEVV